MVYNSLKNFFFITTYDHVSAEVINTLFNNHPDFKCHYDRQSTLLPTVNNTPLQEYMNLEDRTGFVGNVKSFTAFSFAIAKCKADLQDDIKVINITMPISLRIKLLLYNWLRLGLSEEEVHRVLLNELQQLQVADLINYYNFNVVYNVILTHIAMNIKMHGLNNYADATSPRAKIFYIALALSISLDEMDSMVAKHNVAFDSMLQDPDLYFNLVSILSNQKVNIASECKDKLTVLVKNFNQDIMAINKLEFSIWQNELITWCFNNLMHQQLRSLTIQSSFLSLVYSLNLLKSKFSDACFYIANKQLLLKNTNIHYELILLQIPVQMREKSLLLPRSVLQNMYNPNTRFLYDLSLEAVTFGDGNQDDWLAMHRILKEAGVPAHKIYFICCNYNVSKYYSQWADKYSPDYRINVFGNHFMPLVRIHELIKDKEFQKIKHQLIDIAKKTVTDNIYRPHYFMCLNLKTRVIRTALLLFLLHRNHFAKGIITYLGRQNLSPSEIKISEQNDPFFAPEQAEWFYDQLPEGKSLLQYFNQLEAMVPIVYDVKANDQFDGNWPLKQLIPELAKYGVVEQFESYFEIVTETYFLNESTLNITEKTIKPILRFQMFIIVGSPHILSALHELGFQTFSPYIDETYDTITDPVQRFICIMKEIDRLCSLSIDELHQLYCKLWPRILHNYNRLTQDGYELLTRETDKLLQEFICV